VLLLGFFLIEANLKDVVGVEKEVKQVWPESHEEVDQEVL